MFFFCACGNALIVPTCELQKNLKHIEFLNVLIVNYAQMTTDGVVMMMLGSLIAFVDKVK
jgi:hypothetical protein